MTDVTDSWAWGNSSWAQNTFGVSTHSCPRCLGDSSILGSRLRIAKWNLQNSEPCSGLPKICQHIACGTIHHTGIPTLNSISDKIILLTDFNVSHFFVTRQTCFLCHLDGALFVLIDDIFMDHVPLSLQDHG